VRSVRITEEVCAQIRAAGTEHGVALSVHAPYYIKLNADKEEWPKSRKRLMDAAYYGHLAGATDIIFHPGSTFGDREQALRTAIPRLADCLEELANSGNPVRLRPETMGKGAQLGSINDMIAINQALPEVEPCLDFAHIHARTGDGSCNTYDEWAQMLERFAASARIGALQRLHFHLSGIAYTAKGEKHHLMLQESDLDLQALLGALTAFDCGGRIVNESPGDMAAEAHLIRKLWNEIRA